MADSQQHELPTGSISSESKLKQHTFSDESIASSLSDSSNKKLVFVANRFNSLRWTTAHKFITEYCDVQLHHPMAMDSNTPDSGPELYDSLEDMIKDAFTGDLLPGGKTLWKTDLQDLCTDERLRSLKGDWFSDFNYLKTVDSATSSYQREDFRQMQLFATRDVIRQFSELNLTDKSPSELVILNKLEEFIESYLYLLGKNLTSEDSYRKCFEKFLAALFLQTLSPPAKQWRYLRPAIAWSHSGKTVAEPDGTVLTKQCLMKCFLKAFACIEVKGETKNKEARNAERCLKERKKEERPKLPWHHIQEVLHGVLPQHFLELLLSADDTVFKSVKKEGSRFQRYLTKVGLIQQGMRVNVVILKIKEDDFWWLVPGEEKGQKLHKEYEASKRSRNCPEAAESVPNEEVPGPERENPNEAISSESDEEHENNLTFVEKEIDNDNIVKEKGLRSARSQKKVRFKDVDFDDDSSSGRKHPLLYISKTYSLLNNQERIHLANGLLVLEAIADDIVSDLVE